MRLASRLAQLLAVLALVACGRPNLTPPALVAFPDSAAYVTRLGADTLAVERFVRTPWNVRAEAVLRVPTTTRTRYTLDLGPTGEMTRFEGVTTDARAAGGAGMVVRRELIVREGDSLRIETTAEGQTRTRMVAASAATLPFLDMVHWPFEVALVRARGRGSIPPVLPLLTGARVQDFPLAAIGTDSVTITHPLRGTMRVQVDPVGRVLALDAGATTRKLTLERRPWMSLDAFAERWAAADAEGKGIGNLSGRAEENATVGGATLTIDYGTPAKRGREIWGALVPYGSVWRTGANQATQFSTSRDLVLGSGSDTLVVPAGSYSLFSIPAAEGGVLIVNRQTNQAGTAYDAAQDLGRVRMVTRPIDETVEIFTIDIAPLDAGAELRLRWDRAERVVPIRARN